MVAVPWVRDSFPSTSEHTAGECEGRFHSECFILTVLVDRRKINRAAWSAIMFSRYHHTVTSGLQR